ncbi:sn-glycerol-3-phosphate ABC transporter ATP-binding protein UgpC [Aquibium sp. ELW1220]|uniref:ABC transporter ATP-binding protein n=1 Tax=Aquibium sp. ELW1220 TaxID=2976766 RepID=UPI0025B18D8D|nr:sn-glycerol-3-phosphate ABC transporter ATP-binding protein UgpC [Aquibium sp. ELW1220]MDN2580900.1 sn-glycerol-3-phosphate ABC transporter ATP-binding protein UgpC [Aquibium sp. ELW1220]
MASIDITNVHKLYGRTPAVRGLDLSVEDGSFLVILGPSGCGKSTLLRMIAGLEDITAGEIAIDGRVVNDVEPGRRGCAMVFQNYALYPHMTVAENIGYALKVAGVAKAERRERIGRVAAMLGLGDLLDRKPSQLSGGQRQRVAMGRAMVRQPGIFLFDEPLSNLDAKLRIQMRLEIKRLHRELKTTSVFVTHDQVEAMTLADTLVVMNQGVIEQVGTPAEVFRRPKSRFVANFLGSPPMNFLPAGIDRRGRAVLAGGRAPWPELTFDLPAGSAIEIGLRPGDLGLVAGRETDGAIPFQPDILEDLGNELHWHGTVEGNAVAVALPAATAIPSGPVCLKAPPSAVHAFLGDGRRVEPEAAPIPTPKPSGEAPWRATSLSYT